MATILQSDLLVNFLYPMLLVFVLMFGILQKTKVFGEDKTQTNAVLSLVIALIFVGAVFPKIMVANLVQFMSVGLFIIFVALMLWGFISGNSDLTVMDDKKKKIHKIFAILIFGAVIFGVLWATGFGEGVVNGLQKVFAGLFGSTWSIDFWTNFVIILLVLVVIFVVTGFNPFKKNPDKWWITLKK